MSAGNALGPVLPTSSSSRSNLTGFLDDKAHRPCPAVSGRSAKARGYRRLATIRTVIFLISGKLNFSGINPHAT